MMKAIHNLVCKPALCKPTCELFHNSSARSYELANHCKIRWLYWNNTYIVLTISVWLVVFPVPNRLGTAW